LCCLRHLRSSRQGSHHGIDRCLARREDRVATRHASEWCDATFDWHAIFGQAMLAATPKEESMNRCILIGCEQTVPESRRLYCSDAHRDEFYRWVRSQSRDETIGGLLRLR
jgi:hypothetical protein